MDNPYDPPTKPILSRLRLLSIAKMICQESASMVYKAINGQVPYYLSSLFNSIPAVMNRTVLNSNLNLRPPIKNKMRSKQFCIPRGYDLELLPNGCKTANTFPSFKMKLKTMLA